MLKYFLKIDYNLSMWFARKNKKTALDDTVHIFLTKQCFVFQAFYFILLPLFPFNFGIEIEVLLIMVITGVIMYGFPEAKKKKIKEYKIEKEYKITSLQQRKARNTLGLFYLISFFITMFYIGITFFSVNS